MRSRKIEIYRVERERRELPAIYDKIPFRLTEKELRSYPADFLPGGEDGREAQIPEKMECEAVCRVMFDMSGWME